MLLFCTVQHALRHCNALKHTALLKNYMQVEKTRTALKFIFSIAVQNTVHAYVYNNMCCEWAPSAVIIATWTRKLLLFQLLGEGGAFLHFHYECYRSLSWLIFPPSLSPADSPAHESKAAHHLG